MTMNCSKPVSEFGFKVSPRTTNCDPPARTTRDASKVAAPSLPVRPPVGMA